MPDRPIQLILDASVILAFVRESIDVGEVIAEVDAEEAAVGLPVLCLAQARTVVDDVDRLKLSRPGFVGDSQTCEGRSHASTEEVPGRGP